MTYPNINPIDIGRDGWSSTYNTPVSRLLFLCGLAATDFVRNPQDLRASVHAWRVRPEALIPDWRPTQETRPIKPTIASVRRVLEQVRKSYDEEAVRHLLRIYGNCTTIGGLRLSYYGAVYTAAMARLNPRQSPPSNKRMA